MFRSSPVCAAEYGGGSSAARQLAAGAVWYSILKQEWNLRSKGLQGDLVTAGGIFGIGWKGQNEGAVSFNFIASQ